jgi:hypothetical protein
MQRKQTSQEPNAPTSPHGDHPVFISFDPPKKNIKLEIGLSSPKVKKKTLA